MAARDSLEARQKAAAVIASVVQYYVTIYNSPEAIGAEVEAQIFETLRACRRLEELLNVQPKLGRGHSRLPRLVTVKFPAEEAQRSYVWAHNLPELFKSMTGFWPSEFDDLLQDVSDVFVKARNFDRKYTDEENAKRIFSAENASSSYKKINLNISDFTSR